MPLLCLCSSLQVYTFITKKLTVMRDAPAGVSQEGIDTVDEVGGTALRLLHQLSASLPAAEAISRSVASSQSHMTMNC